MEISAENIKKYRDENGLTQQSMAALLGVSFRTIQNYESGGTIPKSKHEILRNLFKQGKGGLLNSEENNVLPILKEPDAIWVDYEGFMLVPLVGHRAQAGFMSGWGDEEYLEELPKIPWEVDRNYKGKYMTFEVSGDSMESENEPRDSLYERDLLLCREVQKTHWRNKLHINKWDFVIVHKEEGILCKRIIKHDTQKGTLTLHSLNSYYEDFTVKIDDLIAIFNIIDVKRSRRR